MDAKKSYLPVIYKSNSTIGYDDCKNKLARIPCEYYTFTTGKQMRKKFLIAIVAAFLIAIVCLLSCTPSSPTAPATSPSTSASGVLRLWDSGPITLDPAITSELTSHVYITQIFSGLVRLDSDLKPAPDIASKWEISDDGRTYTFYLREGVKFHDGREVTAEDFKYSWERACSPSTSSQTAATYLGDIVGAEDMLTGRAQEISGIEILDEYAIKITIESPKAYFLAKLAYSTAFVVDRANVESKEEWWREPNGTGPFKLTEWKKDELIVLEQNSFYYGEPARLEKVRFQLLSGIPLVLYETNEIDVAAISQYYIDRVTDKNGPFYEELTVFPELSFFYIGFNVEKPPFDDVSIRRAFCHAIDKEKIIKIIQKGTTVEAPGILPPGIPGYNPDLVGLEYDVAKAKSLIENSKYGSVENLPPITLTDAGYGNTISDFIGALVYDWRNNLGVEVNVRLLEWEIYSFPKYLKEEADEMFTYGWIADYVDPQDFLDILFHSQADYNAGNYSNPQVDELLAQAAVEVRDDKKRIELYQKAEQLLVDDAACLPLWFNTNYVLIKPYVNNYKLDLRGIPTLSEVSINK
jgi:oligopeptide transport system substrate-binding protein